MSKIHIGKKIKEAVDKSNLTVEAFARSINMTRDGANKLFSRENIHAAQLQKISEILGFDFFTFYRPELSQVREPKDKFGYVSKEELNETLRNFEKSVKAEFQLLREELSVKKPAPYKAVKPRKNSKK